MRWDKRERGLVGSIPHSRGSCVLTHLFLLFPKRKITGWKGISWHCAALLLGRGNASKIRLFPSLSPMHSVSDFFAPLYAGIYPLDSWTSTKALFFVGDCLSQCSLGAPRLSLGGAGASSWATLGSTARTEVCMPIICNMSGWDSSWVLVYGADDRT